MWPYVEVNLLGSSMSGCNCNGLRVSAALPSSSLISSYIPFSLSRGSTIQPPCFALIVSRITGRYFVWVGGLCSAGVWVWVLRLNV